MNKTFTRIHQIKQGYFLRRQKLENPSFADDLIAVDLDKDSIFELLKKYEEAGIPVYVENLQGERLS